MAKRFAGGQKRTYAAPTLVIYGDIVNMTASGSTPINEGTGVGNRDRHD